jgi:hypothetical protein
MEPRYISIEDNIDGARIPTWDRPNKFQYSNLLLVGVKSLKIRVDFADGHATATAPVRRMMHNGRRRGASEGRHCPTLRYGSRPGGCIKLVFASFLLRTS